MTLFDLIKQNGKLITTLYKSGVINPAIIRQFEIHVYYIDTINMGSAPSQAARITASHFKTSLRTVYNARHQMLKLC